jgi:hypothetical protein
MAIVILAQAGDNARFDITGKYFCDSVWFLGHYHQTLDIIVG